MTAQLEIGAVAAAYETEGLSNSERLGYEG
jgi:hypothetical protein